MPNILTSEDRPITEIQVVQYNKTVSPNTDISRVDRDERGTVIAMDYEGINGKNELLP